MEAGFTPLTSIAGKDTAIMPKEAALSGDSLAFQLFFNRLIGCIFKLKEKDTGIDPAATLKDGLIAFFRDTGHQPPDDLEVEAGESTEGGSVPMRILFTPPRTILASAEPLEFTVNW
jgi:hypothetical protein